MFKVESSVSNMKTLKLVKIYALIVLYGLMCAAGFVCSQITQSLVLLLDSYHNLFTTLSLILLVISHKVSGHEQAAGFRHT